MSVTELSRRTSVIPFATPGLLLGYFVRNDTETCIVQ